jgi:WhiB family transcriptional regulator, redox-sensing transcriptional regulator
MTGRACSRCGRVEQLRRGLCHADYERDRRAGRIESLVSSHAARAHIMLLCVNGWRYREIARAAGIDRTQVAWIVHRGRKRIAVKTEVRICGIDPADRELHYRSGWTEERRRTQRYPEWSEERRREQPRKAWATRRYHRSYEALRDDWERRHPVRRAIPQPGMWTRGALCAQIDNEMFFPEKGGNSRHAKHICGTCDVRQACLDFALDNGIDYGVFGGLSVRQRRRLILERERLAGIDPGKLNQAQPLGDDC